MHPHFNSKGRSEALGVWISGKRKELFFFFVFCISLDRSSDSNVEMIKKCTIEWINQWYMLISPGHPHGVAKQLMPTPRGTNYYFKMCSYYTKNEKSQCLTYKRLQRIFSLQKVIDNMNQLKRFTKAELKLYIIIIKV
jgi:hypothetical protein